MIPAKDISRYQGAWVDTGEPIIMVKISGGDAGLYIDPQAAANYEAVTAADKAFGGYHFAGGTDPVTEANYYLDAMKPWVPGEVPALDWEIDNADPVGWCLKFVTQVHDVAGAWPLVYMNLSTLKAHNWSPVLSKCGLWLADWNNDPNVPINTGGQVYVMQQFSDGPVYDHDEWFGTLDAFKKYGWPEPPVPAPTPTPPAPPTPTPDPTPTPTPDPLPPSPTPDPQPTPPVPPTPTPDPTPEPNPQPTPPQVTFLDRVVAWLRRIFG